jgi:hypothetical protein
MIDSKKYIRKWARFGIGHYICPRTIRASPKRTTMNSPDWLLLVVGSATKPMQPVQLQKALFLLDRNLQPAQKGAERIYSFAPYDYGPFDSSVYSDAESMAREGLVSIQRPPGQTYKVYGVTEAGRNLADQIAQQLAPGVHEYAKAIVAWIQSLSFQQLVSAVYRDYPDMKVNSVFKR